jgi:hypothetical protein
MKSIFVVYMAWVLILVPRAIWVVYTSDYREKVGDDTFQYFVLMFTTLLTITLIIGAVLAWLTQKGNVWARWVFILFCAFYAIDSLLGTLQITDMYKQTYQYGWFRGPVSVVVWAVLAWLAWYSRPNKAPQSDA